MPTTPNPDKLRAGLLQAIAEAKAPGACAIIGDAEHTYLHDAQGARQLIPTRLPVETSTLYDLASLTKVIATTTALMQLYEAGEIDLDQPVSDIYPIPAFSAFTIRHCLTHTTGLSAGLPYYKDAKSIDEMLQRYSALPLKWTPGSRWLYSDVGFMLLGRIVELKARDSIDSYCKRHIFDPLEMTRTLYTPPKDLAPLCAATEQCAWRKRVIAGEVHDENCSAVGGVAGHAGLFGTAEDLARFCRALLTGRLLKSKTVSQMTAFGQTIPYPWQGLGWQIDPWASKNQGYLPSRTAIGHTGWTGTSIWMDTATGLFAVLLGNTCHPSRTERDNGLYRRVFYTAVAKEFYVNTTTHSGLDRLLREDFAELRGHRIALLTNHAAVDQQGRHALDVLKIAPDVRIATLYSPEHGIRGHAEAGESVASENGPIPVVSLYGDRKFPSKEELESIDYFVVDLQDIGSRYYTYMSTMKDCLAACAAMKKTALILDRPNPVGGAVLEGTIAQTVGSPVCCAPIPVRHGMTMGELALYFLQTEFSATPLRVLVSPLDNCERARFFDECTLPWVPPSPNMPTAETALLYVGTCLFEGVNVNEGRGTDTPFHVMGSPWMDAKRIVENVHPEDRPGIDLEPVRYTPKAIPGKAANPAYRDEACEGVRLIVRDKRSARPFRTAIALLAALRELHPRKLEFKPMFDVLAGGDALRTRIQNGDAASAIVLDSEAALAAFDAVRPKRYE
ncbi:MAG: hypothetical protein AMXMBFR84_02490 [Candidatus Hydrogenedentota bacterium]